MPMTTKYQNLLPKRMVIMSTSHGTRADGTSISDEAVEAMADEAEHSV